MDKEGRNDLVMTEGGADNEVCNDRSRDRQGQRGTDKDKEEQTRTKRNRQWTRRVVMTCGDDRRDRQEQGGTDKDKEGPNDYVMTDDPGDHYM